MGVACVYSYPMTEGQSGQQVVDNIQNRLSEMGASKMNAFVVDCESYQMVQSAQKMIHLLHNSEFPVSSFASADLTYCMVADNHFDQIVGKLKDFYKLHKNSKVESKGQVFQLVDFIIRVGSVVLGQNTSLKGILLEVEYLPCVQVSECDKLIREFMSEIVPNIDESNIANKYKTKGEELYMPSDTMIQYLEHFSNLRKVSLTQ